MKDDKKQHVIKITILGTGILVLFTAISYYTLNSNQSMEVTNLEKTEGSAPPQPYIGMIFSSVYISSFDSESVPSNKNSLENLNVASKDLAHLMLPISGSSLSPGGTNIIPGDNSMQDDQLFKIQPVDNHGNPEASMQPSNNSITVETDQKQKLLSEDLVDPSSYKEIVKSKIYPSDKNELVKIAQISAGKRNPFLAGNHQNPLATLENPKKNRATMKQNFEKLPTINLPESLNKGTQAPDFIQIDEPPPINIGQEGSDIDFNKYDEQLALQGIVGKSAIVNINGETRAIKPGENFKKVKLLSITKTSATFEEDGKTQVKYLDKIR